MSKFIEAWKGNSAGEMATAQQHFLELCEALEVPKPTPKEQEDLTYRFEMPVEVLVRQGQKSSTERMDVYKKDHFIWENKQGSEKGSGRQGHGRRGSKAWQVAMAKAFNQARRYAVNLPGDAPPFLIVCDVGHHIEVWRDFSGKGKHYEEKPSQLYSYDDLKSEKTRDYLRRVMTDPRALDPSVYQDEVTRRVAKDLAKLAKALEKSGHSPAETAQFLMRCIFTMFAEDVELLPSGCFTSLLGQLKGNAKDLPEHLEHLWALMDKGGFSVGVGKVLQFNGSLFRKATALSLTNTQVESLHIAATHDWSEVEPTIFGTLVERALNEEERHKLGAHFTPRPYIERLVRPTVIEPLRDDWLAVQAAAIDALGEGEPSPESTQKAIDLLKEFHRKLCQVKVLDPACGTGNFLYVTYDLLKDLEAEVLRRLSDLGEKQLVLQVAGETVMPTQMLGIEVNPRAREIADLVLWIGHLQRMRRDGTTQNIPEPVLQRASNIECRDAVLAWDGDPVPRLDADGQIVKTWNRRKTKTDPITGAKVPGVNAAKIVYDYPNSRQAEWPESDYIVSNPPFLGNKRMREELGDGYTEALRSVWPDVPGGVDYVMYWWERSAQLLHENKIKRFGLITTNSITQVTNRVVIQPHFDSGLALLFAIADHPWVNNGAAVRIAMTAAGKAGSIATMGNLEHEQKVENDLPHVEIEYRIVESIHADLSAGADLSSLVPLKSNSGVTFQGFNPVGRGFVLLEEELEKHGLSSAALPPVVKPYLNARDITQGGSLRFIIDFHGLTTREAQDKWPSLYQRVLEQVKPARDKNRDKQRRRNWWLFGRTSQALRDALDGLDWFIITPITSKHRFFVSAPPGLAPDCQLHAIASNDSSILGVLSSRFHTIFALRTGSTLEDRPRWRSGPCFDPFPFPDLDDSGANRDGIAQLAERLDAHRKHVQALGRIAGKQAHLTNQYNALSRAKEARTGGPPLTEKERAFHEGALIGLLQSLHDELDTAVAEAYGWPVDLTDQQVLERLVALNNERAAAEAQGKIRWLRQEFQAPEESKKPVQLTTEGVHPAAPAPVTKQPWPKDAQSRLLAVRDALMSSEVPLTDSDLAGRFKGARKKAVLSALSSLEALGIIFADDDGAYSPSV